MDWLVTLGAVASIVAAITGIASAVFSFVVWLGQRKEPTPNIVCKIDPVKSRPGVYLVIIEADNYSATRWTMERVDFRCPKAMRAIRRQRDAQGEAVMPTEIGPSRSIQLSGELAPAGRNSGSQLAGSRDRAKAAFYIQPLSPSSSRIRAIKISMRLILASMEPVQRHTVIAIKRTLPPTTSERIE